jgi:hypothetical protein
MSNQDQGTLSQLAENYRFYGDMRFKQLTLFMAAMSAAIGGVIQSPDNRWSVGLAALFVTAVMWTMEVRSTVNAIANHDALRKEQPSFFPNVNRFWPWLNASFAVLSLHIAFYGFWLSRIRVWCPVCSISFWIGVIVGLMLVIFSVGNYWRNRQFWHRQKHSRN